MISYILFVSNIEIFSFNLVTWGSPCPILISSRFICFDAGIEKDGFLIPYSALYWLMVASLKWISLICKVFSSDRNSMQGFYWSPPPGQFIVMHECNYTSANRPWPLVAFWTARFHIVPLCSCYLYKHLKIHNLIFCQCSQYLKKVGKTFLWCLRDTLSGSAVYWFGAS